jgi:hypothetical protein
LETLLTDQLMLLYHQPLDKNVLAVG